MSATIPVPEYDEDEAEAFIGPGYADESAFLDEEDNYEDGYEDYEDEQSAAHGPEVPNADQVSLNTH